MGSEGCFERAGGGSRSSTVAWKMSQYRELEDKGRKRGGKLTPRYFRARDSLEGRLVS